MSRVNRFFSVVSAALAGALLVGSANAGEVRYVGEGHAYHPVWSRDGKYLAFEVNRYAGDTDLFVSEVTGAIAKDATKITLPGASSAFGSSGIVAVNPSWAKGNVAVFEGSNQGGQFRLYYFQPGAGAPAEMITTAEIPGDLTFPNVAPDGSRMAFVSDQTGSGDVRSRDNTGKITQVTKNAASEVFPEFSADNSKLIFTRKSNNTEDVFVVDAATGAETLVSGGGGDQSRPHYAGSKIVYFDSSRGDNQWDLAVIDGPGGTKKVLAKGVRLPLRARPAVSPDGKWVAFAYDDPTKSGKIMIESLDGATVVEIGTEFTACGEPAIGVQNGRYLLAFTALPSAGATWRFLYVMDVTDKLQ